MIRDFSLVFLLLISDRRNLHRDSRRDTEQNVPCLFTCSFPQLAHTHRSQQMVFLHPSTATEFAYTPLTHRVTMTRFTPHILSHMPIQRRT